MRIMTSYIQALIIVKNFDLNWNVVLLEFLNRTTLLLSPEIFENSLECFTLELYDAEVSPNIIYFKVGLIALFPICLTILTSLIWIFIRIA